MISVDVNIVKKEKCNNNQKLNKEALPFTLRFSDFQKRGGGVGPAFELSM